MLGRYLIRDLILKGDSVCVLVRSSRRDTAVDRVETILRRWENKLGRTLARPVVIEGDLASEQLGLNSSDRQWLQRHCRRVLHSAASLKFESDEQGEPELTNVVGTRQLLEFCSQSEVSDFHYVSTAYVAGLRKGVVRESELDVGQDWGNVYERTKTQSEAMVRSSRHFQSVTVYRPSIIVGDSQDGYTTTYHGFYTPLRLAHAVFSKFPMLELDETSVLGMFGFKGQDKKNLIPVDWVSEAITELMADRKNYGQTYHLTHPNPTPVAEMYKAFLQELRPAAVGRSEMAQATYNHATQSEWFKNQMRVYEAYWRDDPIFDRTNTVQALPDLPVPDLKNDVLRLMSRFAIDANFGWPGEPTCQSPSQVRQWLDRCSSASWDQPHINIGLADLIISFSITGPGGIDCSFVIQQGIVCDICAGVIESANVLVYLNSATLAELIEDSLSVTEGLDEGRILIFGDETDSFLTHKFLQDLLSDHTAEALETC